MRTTLPCSIDPPYPLLPIACLLPNLLRTLSPQWTYFQFPIVIALYSASLITPILTSLAQLAQLQQRKVYLRARDQ
jgi:hypothetical protein